MLRLFKIKYAFLVLALLSGTIVFAQNQYPKEDIARANFMEQVAQKHARIQIPKPPYAYTVQNVKFEDSGTGLHYGATLTKPIGKTSFPTVVLISGTGAQDRDYSGANHKAFWVLANYLSNHGIAVLRMDDRGIGETNGMYMMATSQDFAKDAYAGVKWLYTRSDIDTSRIGLIGHSEGGILGPMVYKMNPSAIKFMVLISGPTIGLREVNRIQTRQYFNDAFKHNDTLVNAYMGLHQYVVDRIPEEANIDKPLKQLLEKAADTFYRVMDPAVAKELRVTNGEHRGDALQGYFMSFLKPWWQFILPYHPVNDIRQVKCPVFGIYGDKDQQVPPVESLRLLKNNLPRNKYHKMIMYKNMNHFMQPDITGDPKNYESISVTIMPVVLEQINKWINQLPVK